MSARTSAAPTLPAECCAPLSAPSITEAEADATAALFKALSDPHRVRIVNLLSTSDGPVCVCDLTDELKLSQPTVSHHLKKLVLVGLIEREQRGVWAYYSIRPDALEELGRVFQA